jgi:hypothetical protein
MQGSDEIALPDCVHLRGAGMGATLLRWKGYSNGIGATCGMKNTFIIGPTHSVGDSITISDLSVEAVAARGCSAVVGSNGGVGFTLQKVNISMWADMKTWSAFGSLIALADAQYFLIEDSRFLHVGNNTCVP